MDRHSALVERATRCPPLGLLPGGRHDSSTVRHAIVAGLGSLPPNPCDGPSRGTGAPGDRHSTRDDPLRIARLVATTSSLPLETILVLVLGRH